MNKLPIELIAEVCVRLRFHDAVKLWSTCRRFKSLIPSFFDSRSFVTRFLRTGAAKRWLRRRRRHDSDVVPIRDASGNSHRRHYMCNVPSLRREPPASVLPSRLITEIILMHGYHVPVIYKNWPFRIAIEEVVDDSGSDEIIDDAGVCLVHSDPQQYQRLIEATLAAMELSSSSFKASRVMEVARFLLVGAVHDNDADLLSKLIAKGVDPPFSALRLACRLGHVDQTWILVKEGHLNPEDFDNVCFYEAVSHARVSVCRKLLDEFNVILGRYYRNSHRYHHNGPWIKVAADTLRCELAIEDFTDIFRMLLDLGKHSSDSTVAFWAAARNGNVRAMRFLVEFGGADPSKSKSILVTLIRFGALHSYLDAITYCLECGVDPTYNNSQCLLAACKHGSLEVVQLLLQWQNAGIRIAVTMDDLECAAGRSTADILNLLLDHLTSQQDFARNPNKFDVTPVLLVAASNGNDAGCVSLLEFRRKHYSRAFNKFDFVEAINMSLESRSSATFNVLYDEGARKLSQKQIFAALKEAIMENAYWALDKLLSLLSSPFAVDDIMEAVRASILERYTAVLTLLLDLEFDFTPLLTEQETQRLFLAAAGVGSERLTHAYASPEDTPPYFASALSLYDLFHFGPKLKDEREVLSQSVSPRLVERLRDSVTAVDRERAILASVVHRSIPCLQMAIAGVSRNSLHKAFQTAVALGYPEIVEMLLSTGMVDPSIDDNEALVYCAASGFTDMLRILLSDSRVRSGVPRALSRAVDADVCELLS